MHQIRVNPEKCLRCGVCARVCPSSQIVLSVRGVAPAPHVPRPCHGCGHCYAACPAHAISIYENGIKMVEPEEIGRDWRISADKLADFLQMRRSIRFFTQKPVPRDMIEKLLDSGRWAPTACNKQDPAWIVMTSPREIRRLAEAVAIWAENSTDFKSIATEFHAGRDTIFRNAPCVILTHLPDSSFGQADAAIALEELALILFASGIGSCLSGLTARTAREKPELLEYLDIGKGRLIFGALMAGFPAVHFFRKPPRKPLHVEWR